VVAWRGSACLLLRNPSSNNTTSNLRRYTSVGCYRGLLRQRVSIYLFGMLMRIAYASYPWPSSLLGCDSLLDVFFYDIHRHLQRGSCETVGCGLLFSESVQGQKRLLQCCLFVVHGKKIKPRPKAGRWVYLDFTVKIKFFVGLLQSHCTSHWVPLIVVTPVIVFPISQNSCK